jgi:hypothetical protein
MLPEPKEGSRKTRRSRIRIKEFPPPNNPPNPEPNPRLGKTNTNISSINIKLFPPNKLSMPPDIYTPPFKASSFVYLSLILGTCLLYAKTEGPSETAESYYSQYYNEEEVLLSTTTASQ